MGAISAVRDGDLDTFVNLDSDVGVGCTCWNSDKIGSTGLMVIKQREPVARIKLTQGGDSIYSVSRMKIQCGNRKAYPSYFEHVYDDSPDVRRHLEHIDDNYMQCERLPAVP